MTSLHAVYRPIVSHTCSVFNAMAACCGTEDTCCLAVSAPTASAQKLMTSLLMPCRDIKLENTLLDATQPQPNVKICDFGYSKNEFVDSRPKTVSGTPDYIAPEVLMADQYDGKKADIWSCGVMLYVMVTGARLLPVQTMEVWELHFNDPLQV